MRRKKQIQAMQQELALLRQTIDSGKELAALATNTAQQLKKPSIKTVAVQLMRSPRFRRTALIVGGAAARRPAGDRGRHGRGRGHRAGKDPQGEKAPPLRRSEQAKFKRAARAQHVLRCKLGADTKCWLPLRANFAV